MGNELSGDGAGGICKPPFPGHYRIPKLALSEAAAAAQSGKWSAVRPSAARQADYNFGERRESPGGGRAGNRTLAIRASAAVRCTLRVNRPLRREREN